MVEMRKETDSLGVVEVPANKLWGAQTQRSLEHFSIGKDLIPREMITSYATLKKAAANAKSAELAGLPPNAVQCMSTAEQAEIANFLPPASIATVPTLSPASLGAQALVFLSTATAIVWAQPQK